MRKVCTQCNKKKDESKFYILANGATRAECRKCSSDRANKWARNNRNRVNAKCRKWRENNLERAKQIDRKQRLNQKRRCMNRYGGKCVCCGEQELSFLTLDHIKDDGKQNQPGDRLRYWMVIKLNFPRGLQTLCFNCQWGKRINKGFCPHHPRKDLRNPPVR